MGWERGIRGKKDSSSFAEANKLPLPIHGSSKKKRRRYTWKNPGDRQRFLKLIISWRSTDIETV